MLAIAGGKGGSGKTTTTLGLAAALDGPTLVVDADCDMPNLHGLAGVDRTPTLAAVADADPESVAHDHPDEPGVTVIPAPRSDEDVSDIEPLLSRAASAERTTLVDCPAGASPDAVAPLRAADGVLLVSPLCAAALRDTAKTAAMSRELGTPVVGAVLTRTRLKPDGVSDLLGCRILAAVPSVRPPVLQTAVVRSAYARLASALPVEEDLIRATV
ncbi:septum site-determining protein MinD [Halogranum gelatinilyticum]|uniref:Septum site-determining protein MinD n=1 Tax=Halogranum gelatinilyticum TaxID=660521 RepID=A0A1G9WC84_9EURY|nr:CDP-4-keto-6-deoxy-D-glucose-3-dehydrase [Halogranum gelatinilyticum]SDM81883.1 septum site-determining protein MinD [Halogranum gelatinilyticum]